PASSTTTCAGRSRRARTSAAVLNDQKAQGPFRPWTPAHQPLKQADPVHRPCRQRIGAMHQAAPPPGQKSQRRPQTEQQPPEMPRYQQGQQQQPPCHDHAGMAEMRKAQTGLAPVRPAKPGAKDLARAARITAAHPSPQQGKAARRMAMMIDRRHRNPRQFPAPVAQTRGQFEFLEGMQRTISEIADLLDRAAP
ncbi:hypothetical protein KXV85_002666, partial [Aspergillus fumigatus]